MAAQTATRKAKKTGGGTPAPPAEQGTARRLTRRRGAPAPTADDGAAAVSQDRDIPPAAPESVAIDDLVPDPANRRSHGERNVGLIASALREVGAARSIVIDEDNVILAGNGVQRGAKDAGLTRVRVVEASGDELIAVRRRNLTAEQKRALAMYDNRAGELAEWNAEQLRADHEIGLDLTPFFDATELARLKVIDAPPLAPGERGDVVVGQCAVIVICKDEGDQQRTYEALLGQGYECRVVNT